MHTDMHPNNTLTCSWSSLHWSFDCFLCLFFMAIWPYMSKNIVRAGTLRYLTQTYCTTVELLCSPPFNSAAKIFHSSSTLIAE